MLPRLLDPVAPLIVAAATGALSDVTELPVLRSGPEATVGITLAVDGYPEAPRTGDALTGITEARHSGALVFGAGVRRDGDARLVTGGGRVVTVVGTGANLETAAAVAYAAAAQVEFSGRRMRTDIGRSLVGAAA